MAWAVGLAAAALSAAGCDAEGDAKLGQRDPCASASGVLIGCGDATVATADDACWKLVECAVIPLESDGFDWASCVARLGEQPAAELSFILACIEVSTCDELVTSGSPSNPTSSEIRCLAYGAQ
jgi:hypothetical protein